MQLDLDSGTQRAPRPLSILLAVAAIALIALLGSAVGPAQSESAVSGKRTCGLLPGDGAYSYYRVRNVSCRVARKVSRRAGKNFCGHRYENCQTVPGGKIYKGRVKAQGWRCKMKVGYEFYRSKCKRRDQRFKHESAA